MTRSDVRRAQKQAFTVVDKNDTFKDAVSLLPALHLANKCKSKGEKLGFGALLTAFITSISAASWDSDIGDTAYICWGFCYQILMDWTQ